MIKGLNEVDACLFFCDGESIEPNVFYLTGYLNWGFLTVKKNSLLVLTHKGEEEVVKQLGVKYKIVKDFKKGLNKELSKCKKIGFAGEWLSFSGLQRFKKLVKNKWIDVSEGLLDLRSIKSQHEVTLIKKSINIAENILKDFFANIKDFKDETEAKNFLKINTILNNCELAFEPIIASGSKAAGMHFRDSKKWLKGFCVVDFGVKYKGYCSDITRTFYRGKPTKKDLELYSLVVKVQEECIKKVKPGMKFKEIEEIGRKIFGKLNGNFVHSLGHGFGVEIHEKPRSDNILKQGMVLTIEPGLYFEGKCGLRIEDDILVTKTGCKVLTKLSKNLLIV